METNLLQRSRAWPEWLSTWLEEAKRLRLEEEEAGVRFLAHLHDGERRAAHKEAGYPTFDAFIKAQNLVDPARYRTYVAGVAELGAEQVAAIGFFATEAVLRIPNDAPSASVRGKMAKDAAIMELVDFKKRNHVLASQQHARTLSAKHYVPPRQMRETTPLDDARAELRVVKRRVLELEEELARVSCERSSFAKALGPARSAEILKTIKAKDVASRLEIIRSREDKAN